MAMAGIARDGRMSPRQCKRGICVTGNIECAWIPVCLRVAVLAVCTEFAAGKHAFVVIDMAALAILYLGIWITR